jgi:hypothetical protein
MTDRTVAQDAEDVRTRAVWQVGLAGLAVTALVVAIAWWRVAPPSVAARAPAASPLERGLFDRASGGADARIAGQHRLERYDWIDRRARIVRIPIDRAIEAVVADPGLIGATPAASGEASR